jgi:hypothetical protein
LENRLRVQREALGRPLRAYPVKLHRFGDIGFDFRRMALPFLLVYSWLRVAKYAFGVPRVRKPCSREATYDQSTPNSCFSCVDSFFSLVIPNRFSCHRDPLREL